MEMITKDVFMKFKFKIFLMGALLTCSAQIFASSVTPDDTKQRLYEISGKPEFAQFVENEIVKFTSTNAFRTLVKDIAQEGKQQDDAIKEIQQKIDYAQSSIDLYNRGVDKMYYSLDGFSRTMRASQFEWVHTSKEEWIRQLDKLNSQMAYLKNLRGK